MRSSPDSTPVCSPDSLGPSGGSLDTFGPSGGSLDTFGPIPIGLGAAIDLFCAAKAAEGASPRTVEWYRMILIRAVHRFSDMRPVDAIPAAELRAWLLELRATLAPESIAGYVRGLKAFGNWCAAEELAAAAGFRGLRRPKVRSATTAPLAGAGAIGEHIEDLAALLRVARELSSSEAAQESRRAICRAARQLSDGEFAHVFELGPGGKTLILTAADGSGIDTLELSLTDRRSLVSDSFLSGQPLFSGDVLADDRVDKEAAGRVGIRAGCFQPIIREGRPIGVLVVGWPTRIEVLSPRVASLVAAVLERADLIARLVELARTDALTGLSNRRALDEFLGLVLPDCEVSAGLRTIERLQRKVPADQTFSAGIAARLPGECAADLLQRADAAMYLAKGSGRNRTVIAQASSPAADVRDPRPV